MGIVASNNSTDTIYKDNDCCCDNATQCQPEPLTVQTWGGSYQDAQRAVFDTINVPVILTAQPPWGTSNRKLINDGVNSDVLDELNPWDTIRDKEKLFEHLDIGPDSALKAENRTVVSASDSEAAYAIPTVEWAYIGIYNKSAQTNPQCYESVADVFNTTKCPGKRLLPNWAAVNLLIWAALADGVDPESMYSDQGLGNASVQNSSIDKIQALADSGHVVWWAGGNPEQRYDCPSGFCGYGGRFEEYPDAFAITYSGRSIEMDRLWDGMIKMTEYMIVPKTSHAKHVQIRKLLSEYVSDEKLVELCRIIPYVPATESGKAMLQTSLNSDNPFPDKYVLEHTDARQLFEDQKWVNQNTELMNRVIAITGAYLGANAYVPPDFKLYGDV